jgi:hypothetical protein
MSSGFHLTLLQSASENLRPYILFTANYLQRQLKCLPKNAERLAELIGLLRAFFRVFGVMSQKENVRIVFWFDNYSGFR